MNLTSAQKTADAELDEIQGELAHLDRILRGDPEERQPGLLADLDRLETKVREFDSLLNADSAGNPGLLKKIDKVLDNRERAEKREGYHWTFWTAFLPVVVVQLLILIGLVVVNWDHIREYWVIHEHIHQAAAIERNTKRLKARRARKPKPVAVPDPDEPAIEGDRP